MSAVKCAGTTMAGSVRLLYMGGLAPNSPPPPPPPPPSRTELQEKYKKLIKGSGVLYHRTINGFYIHITYTYKLFIYIHIKVKST